MPARRRVSFIVVFTVLILTVLSVCAGIRDKEAACAYTESDGTVYTEGPVITVLNHGLGGSPIDWSNHGYFNNVSGGFINCDKIWENFYNWLDMGKSSYYNDLRFSYDYDSLIEALRRKQKNSETYVLTETYDEEENFIGRLDKFEVCPASPTGYCFECVAAPDFSKHIIIVYNTCFDMDDDTETVYGRFKELINGIVDGYAAANCGIEPKINLIGHSRGTIINLKYATEYPDRVAATFGMGGLYNGAKLAEFVYALGIQDLKVFGYMFGSKFVEEMADDEFVKNLRDEWNAAVKDKDIKAYAVCSTFDGDFVKNFLSNSNFLKLHPTVVFGLNAILTGLQSISGGNLEIDLDGFLTVGSQSGKGYDKFISITRRYGKGSEVSARSQRQVEFPHNLEMRDIQTIKYIAANIDMGNDNALFEYSVNDGEATIENINYSELLEGTLEIPSHINGMPVVKLNKYAFANDFQGNKKINSVIVPDTVRVVEKGAFENCVNLSSVVIKEGDLRHICAYAFSGCTALTAVSLPSDGVKVDEYAFYNCVSLDEFNLNGAENLHPVAFVGCKKLPATKKISYFIRLFENGREKLFICVAIAAVVFTARKNPKSEKQKRRGV